MYQALAMHLQYSYLGDVGDRPDHSNESITDALQVPEFRPPVLAD